MSLGKVCSTNLASCKLAERGGGDDLLHGQIEFLNTPFVLKISCSPN